VTFRNNKNNEAFLDRVYIVKVPYCLRISEEIKIYEKLLNHSELVHAPARRARWKRCRASPSCRA
jgi:serine protein kinase